MGAETWASGKIDNFAIEIISFSLFFLGGSLYTEVDKKQKLPYKTRG